MKKFLPIIIMALFSLSCAQLQTGNESQSLKTDTGAKITANSSDVSKANTSPVDTADDDYPAWVDTLVDSYMKHTNNELVRYSVTHHLKEEWVWDQFDKTDTASYWVFNIGHDVSEPDGSETRYISDSWVYVDSARKKLYEQDLASDKLIEWKK